MTDTPALLGLSGSLRAGSYNTMLLGEAARVFGPCSFEIGSIRLPLYDGDAEAADGIPQSVLTLDGQIQAADAVVIACPEYNKGLPGSLKNALDWLSRTGTSALADKPVALVSAAAGRAGGEVGQTMLRMCLTAFRPRLIAGPAVLIPAANKAFDADGQLTDPASIKFLTSLMDALKAEMAR